MLGGVSTEGESRYRGVLAPESIPAPGREMKSPGVGVAQLSPANMSGGATMMSYSSGPPPLSLLEILVDGTTVGYRKQDNKMEPSMSIG